MNPRLLIRVTAPAVVIGLLLFATCLLSIWYINRLQSNLADILPKNVRSHEAALELEIRVRQLRYHTLLYLLNPEKAQARVKLIEQDQDRFEAALNRARQGSTTDKEEEQVRAIEKGYEAYQA